MKYHTLLFLKIRKDLAKVVVLALKVLDLHTNFLSESVDSNAPVTHTLTDSADDT